MKPNQVRPQSSGAESSIQSPVGASRPECRVSFAGIQPGYETFEPFCMFTIVALSAPSDALCVNSTVSLRTIWRAGFSPVIEGGVR